MYRFTFINILIILFFLTIPSSFSAKEKNKQGGIKKIHNTAQNPEQSLMNINNITSWIRANGYHGWFLDNSYNGAYPKGTTAGVIFAEGIVWGGIVHDGQNPLIRVNGNTFASGCASIFDQPRVFRTRPDFQSGNLADDAASFFNKTLGSVTENDIDSIKEQYKRDWLEWPAEQGAPYFDADSNGIYEPDPNGNRIYGETGEDIPGINGSHQTLFIAYLDSSSYNLYESLPIGLEVHETYWAYAITGGLANVIYKKVDLIYKGTPLSESNSTIDSMFIAQWADTDAGEGVNDFAGCDTVQNLGYVYNSTAQDAAYGSIGLAPAAVGYNFLYGVSRYTGNPTDSAVFNLAWHKGYKYANPNPMSSFIYYKEGQGIEYNYTGTLKFYNLLKGLSSDGTPFPDTIADNKPHGTYLLSGDPVEGTGKLDGNYDPAGDRRIIIVNGPFDLKLGDTAEVVIALVGGLGGSDHLNNVTIMKQNAETAQNTFYNQLPLTGIEDKNNQIIVDKFQLFQNYPNPFNPSTKIRYTIGSRQLVTLKIYDVLGKEIKTLVNEEKPAGSYELEFNASELSSGVYFYRIQADKFTSAKKLVLIK